MIIEGKDLLPFGSFAVKPADAGDRTALTHVHVRAMGEKTIVEASDGKAAGRLECDVTSDLALLLDRGTVGRLLPKDEVHLDRNGVGGPQRLTGPFEHAADRDDGEGQADAYPELDAAFDAMPPKSAKFGFGVAKLLKLADALGVKTLEFRIPQASSASIAYLKGEARGERPFIGCVEQLDMFASASSDETAPAGEEAPTP